MKHYLLTPLPAEKFTTPVEVNYANIAGKWTVYRREAKPGSTSNDKPLLKTLNIENNNNAAQWRSNILPGRENRNSTM